MIERMNEYELEMMLEEQMREAEYRQACDEFAEDLSEDSEGWHECCPEECEPVKPTEKRPEKHYPTKVDVWDLSSTMENVRLTGKSANKDQLQGILSALVTEDGTYDYHFDLWKQ